MTIQMTFDSIDDMKQSILRMAETLRNDKFLELPEKDPEEPVPEPEPTTEPTPEPMPAPEPEPTPEPAPEPKEPKLDLASMRKILSVVNKSTGKNTARELIQAMGYRVLTEMPEDKYPELKAKAEEVINAS